MSRPRRKPRENWTAGEIIADVIAWADRQGLKNIAGEFRRALAQFGSQQQNAGIRTQPSAVKTDMHRLAGNGWQTR
jgi:hypothetical protein